MLSSHSVIITQCLCVVFNLSVLLVDVRDRCSELSCSEDEWCGKKNGVYGCMCNDDLPRPQADSFGW